MKFFFFSCKILFVLYDKIPYSQHYHIIWCFMK
jgi:hypothetical protein